ncbi:MAG TPA: phasin family protein [Steroidobacteraceae bacterium]|nr:phasin family protein [Steroidobacteraceae bacterium]
MANRDTSSDRQRARKRAGGRTSSRVPPRARPRRAADEAQSAQAQLLQNVQQIWLAGMGSIARAQKDGPSAFTDAVLEGLRLLNQSRSTAQRMVRDAFESAQETLQTRVGGARDQAQDTWDNLESLFQSRVQRAMHQLGVPTAEEIRVLTRRVAELNENVKRIDARGRVRKVAGAGRRAGKRARKSVASTPAAK